MKFQTNNRTHMGMKGVVLGVAVVCELGQKKHESKMLVCLCVSEEHSVSHSPVNTPSMLLAPLMTNKDYVISPEPHNIQCQGKRYTHSHKKAGI